jgi:hypothetical protein
MARHLRAGVYLGRFLRPSCRKGPRRGEIFRLGIMTVYVHAHEVRVIPDGGRDSGQHPYPLASLGQRHADSRGESEAR